MNEIRLKLKKDSITHRKCSGNDTIYGILYFRVNNKYYPDRSWDDYIYKVLSTWTYNFLHYNSGCLYFMDGPYWVHYNIKEYEVIFFIEEYGEFKCQREIFVNDLVLCLKSLKEFMEKCKFDKGHILNLSNLLHELQKKYLL